MDIPGITPAERSRFSVPAPVVLPGPQPETPVMSHVLFVDSWRDAETPLAWADALRERMPNLLGLVTPLSIDDDRQHALVVGPAYSAAEADGGIILLHLGTLRGHDRVHRELPVIIDGLRRKGYALVPVSELHRALALGEDGKGSAFAAER